MTRRPLAPLHKNPTFVAKFNFMKKILIFAILSAAAFPLASAAQEQQPSEGVEIKVTAKFDGTVKAKFETCTEDGAMRFNVRNSRVGVRGMVGSYVDYRIQVELSNEGVFSPLDLYGMLKPFKGLSVILGQSSVPFENSYVITPSEMMFANRAFVGKYFTPGSRDLGMVVNYKFAAGALPLEVQGGVFNGGKVNKPQWTNTPSYALRFIAGSMDGLRASAKAYRYRNELLDQFFVGGDVSYATDRFRIQAEVMNRHTYDTGRDLLGAYLQGAYTFPLRNKMFHNLSPAVRWDGMGYNASDGGLAVNRLTFGINFGLTPLPFGSLLRLDYEQYFSGAKSETIYFADRDDHVMDNKLTLELVVKF